MPHTLALAKLALFLFAASAIVTGLALGMLLTSAVYYLLMRD